MFKCTNHLNWLIRCDRCRASLSRFRHKGENNSRKKPSDDTAEGVSTQENTTPEISRQKDMMFTFSAKGDDTPPTTNKRMQKAHCPQKTKKRRCQTTDESDLLHNWSFETSSNNSPSKQKSNRGKDVKVFNSTERGPDRVQLTFLDCSTQIGCWSTLVNWTQSRLHSASTSWRCNF